MNGKKQAIEKINDFLKSDRKGLLLTGTRGHRKRLLIEELLAHNFSGKRILYREYRLKLINTKAKNPPKAGVPEKKGSNFYTYDTFCRTTQCKTIGKAYDFAIVILLDSLYAKENKKEIDENQKTIDELLKSRNIGQLFLVLDYGFETNAFSKYYTDHVVYDIEDEDAESHRFILESWNAHYIRDAKEEY